ncbi:MAG: hypothetical protein HOP23_10690 [Methylococcaceae bacterium]|nr:hypothetical protein [Methylococcaceae bacterium]
MENPSRQPHCASPRVDRWAAAQTTGGLAASDPAGRQKRLVGSRLAAYPDWGLGWRGRQSALLASLGAPRSRCGGYSALLLIQSMYRWITAWQELARVQAQHFFIEHSFREAKSEWGKADYPVRCWDAWHHHMAMGMLGTLSG